MQQMDPIETHIQTIWSFVRLAALKRVLHEVVPETKVDFWRIMMGASLDYGLIEWCKIFGRWKDDTHWTKVVPASQHDAFRTGLYAATGMKNADEWDAYHKKMKAYRDTLAAHIDFGSKSTNYPDFGPALAAAFYYHATFLYPAWVGMHPRTRYPADMEAFAVDYHKQLLDVANAAAQATKQFEP
ncbi:hypothetical protein [Paraburkholderia adhaesiva]|uniref:hypothetical protein n=1 Tax=Paraburkholderia adhaesiva TaxID=2883244 RepID=UPI001F1CE1DF|nr:hypothetical protein [Paraburkholderia adhaesiva]